MTIERDTAILELIDDIVAKNTFSLEALDSIKTLKDKVKSQAETITELEEQKISDEKRNATLKKEFYEETALRREYENKCNKLLEQEEKAKESIYEAQKQAAVAAAYKDAMQIVFKPHSVREAVFGNKQLMTPSGYPSSYPESHSRETNFE